MRATIEIPDDLYREVEAETAREGSTLREVTISLFERWLRERGEPTSASPEADYVDWQSFQAPLARLIHGEVEGHTLEAMRKSIVQNWNESN